MTEQGRPPAGNEVTGKDESTHISVVGPLTILLKHVRPLVAVPLVAAMAGGALVLLRGSYAAESSFVLEKSSGVQQSQLLGFAAQFGLSLGGMDEGESVDFYSRLLRSRELLTDVTTTDFRFATKQGADDSLSTSLLDLYGCGSGPERRLSCARRKVAKRVSVRVDRTAGVVTVQTRAPWPGLAEQMNRRLLDLVNTFNVEKRSSSAAAQREFLERRMESVREELNAAEEELRIFSERNRIIIASPELEVEQQRLQRQVDLYQQLFITVTQGYEQARMDAVRDTPVITVVESPEGSVEPVWGVISFSALIGVFAFIMTIGIVVVMDYVVRQRQAYPAEYEDLSRQSRLAVRLLLPWLRKYSTSPDSAS
jgi:uncharacterized protein involved in exopolysaccharide biosynthesis